MKKLFLFFLPILLSINLNAATYTTINAGDWSTAANWSGGSIPPTDLNNADVININHNMTGNVTMNGNSGTIDINVAGTVTSIFTSLSINNGLGSDVTGDLIVSGTMTFNKGTHTVSGTLDVGGNLQIFNNAILNLNQADIGANLVLQNGIINISGVVNVNGNADLNNLGSFVNISDYGAFLVGGLLDMDNVDILGTGVVSWGSITMTNEANFQGLNDRIVPSDNPFDLDGIPAVLPVTLINLTAKAIDQNVILTWATSSELNFDYFSLQRSQDGYDYEEIAQIQGHGNSKITRYYDFIDKSPINGTSYYRLVSIDFDGYTEIFRPISINMENSPSFSAYPNPIINNELTLELVQDANSIYSLFDLNGKTILKLKALNRIETIDFSNLLPGIYFLSVNGGVPIKILKQ